jgi:hypothetical protein
MVTARWIVMWNPAITLHHSGRYHCHSPQQWPQQQAALLLLQAQLVQAQLLGACRRTKKVPLISSEINTTEQILHGIRLSQSIINSYHQLPFGDEFCNPTYGYVWQYWGWFTIGSTTGMTTIENCTSWPLWWKPNTCMIPTIYIYDTADTVCISHDATLHYIRLHHATLHRITPHWTTLHYITSTTSHYITSHYVTFTSQLHHIYITLSHLILFHCITFQFHFLYMHMCLYLCMKNGLHMYADVFVYDL